MDSPIGYIGIIWNNGIIDGIMDGYMGSAWWFQPTPLKNDGVRQLGLRHSHGKNWKNKTCSKPPTSQAKSLDQSIGTLEKSAMGIW